MTRRARGAGIDVTRHDAASRNFSFTPASDGEIEVEIAPRDAPDQSLVGFVRVDPRGMEYAAETLDT